MISSTPLTTDPINLFWTKDTEAAQEAPTAINNPDIRPERLAGKICHVAHVITEIPHRKEPMEHGGPDGDPGHKAWVEGDIVPLYDVIDGVVEQGDQTRDADNGQGLRADGTEDYAC